jgi:hypothetical protein
MQTELFLLRAQLMHAREQIEPARFKPGRRSLSSYGGYEDNSEDYSSLNDTSYAWAYGYDENDDSNDCTDLDNGATDPYGDGCAEYTQVPSWCGGYDDSDFLSMQMCCACGGGGDGNQADNDAYTGAYGYDESDGTNDAVDDCSASCYGQSCDYWSDTCVVLESGYNCDCTGCECNDDDGSSGGVPSPAPIVQPSPTPTAARVCEATCFGQSCDFWVSVGTVDCAELESSYSCDCANCACCETANGYGSYGSGGCGESSSCTRVADDSCANVDNLGGDTFSQGCLGALTIGDSVSGSTSADGCNSLGQSSAEHMYHITLAEGTAATCGGEKALLSTCGSGFDTVSRCGVGINGGLCASSRCW